MLQIIDMSDKDTHYVENFLTKNAWNGDKVLDCECYYADYFICQCRSGWYKFANDHFRMVNRILGHTRRLYETSVTYEQWKACAAIARASTYMC